MTIRLPSEEHAAGCAKPNRSAGVRNAIGEKLQRETARPAKPRTVLGRKLLAARADTRRRRTTSFPGRSAAGGGPPQGRAVRRTYLDSSVLIQAVQGVDGDKTVALLEDPEREFVAATFLKLELLPQPTFHKRKGELEFLEAYFQRVAEWREADEQLLAAALKEAAAVPLMVRGRDPCRSGEGAQV